MRECTVQPIGEDNDVSHRQALQTLVFAARFTGVFWILRGVLWCFLIASPLSALAWYGVDPNEFDKYHVAVLGYIRLIMVASEIYYGGFLLVCTMFGDLASTRNCVFFNSGSLFFRALLVVVKKQQYFDHGGFAFDARVLLIDVLIFDVVPLAVCLIALVVTDPVPVPPAVGGTPDKKIIFNIGFIYCMVAIYVGVFKVDDVITQIASPMFMSEGAGFAKLLSGWIGLLAGSFLTTMHTFVILSTNTGAAIDYHCSRCSWTWSCANVICWLAFKVFLESNQMPVVLVNIAFGVAPELFFRHTWMAA